jgi:hypothetical protein
MIDAGEPALALDKHEVLVMVRAAMRLATVWPMRRLWRVESKKIRGVTDEIGNRRVSKREGGRPLAPLSVPSICVSQPPRATVSHRNLRNAECEG